MYKLIAKNLLGQRYYLNVYLRLKFPYFERMGHARDTKYVHQRWFWPPMAL